MKHIIQQISPRNCHISFQISNIFFCLFQFTVWYHHRICIVYALRFPPMYSSISYMYTVSMSRVWQFTCNLSICSALREEKKKKWMPTVASCLSWSSYAILSVFPNLFTTLRCLSVTHSVQTFITYTFDWFLLFYVEQRIVISIRSSKIAYSAGSKGFIFAYSCCWHTIYLAVVFIRSSASAEKRKKERKKKQGRQCHRIGKNSMQIICHQLTSKIIDRCWRNSANVTTRMAITLSLLP